MSRRQSSSCLGWDCRDTLMGRLGVWRKGPELCRLVRFLWGHCCSPYPATHAVATYLTVSNLKLQVIVRVNKSQNCPDQKGESLSRRVMHDNWREKFVRSTASLKITASSR